MFTADDARLKCPFTSPGVAPEAASSYLLPRLVGRQNAAWALLSSAWITAHEVHEAHEMDLVWRLCAPTELQQVAGEHAARLARLPIPSLRAVKRTMSEPLARQIADAREREIRPSLDTFADLMGGPANPEALAAFAEGRQPDFASLPDGA